MRQGHYTLTPATIRAHTQLLCQKHLRLADHGPKCTAGILWAVLLYAASRLSSLAAACAFHRVKCCAESATMILSLRSGLNCWESTA